ncbi:MAG TPA: hypothetical protein VN181_00170, partial [Thermoanaerobaculia bacterium]|nr:hypothetical protein [Thermoanaerobaculia bacterium]
FLCLLISATALAQRPTPLGQLERFEADLRADAVALKRDAFIVAQVMIGIGELRDFQQNSAIQKALDRIEAAQIRAGDKPPANPRVAQILGAMREDLLDARKQGTMADMPALGRALSRRARDLRVMLFHELDDIRRARQVLADLQTRVARLTTEVDDAMGEALGATFDDVRSAGE